MEPTLSATPNDESTTPQGAGITICGRHDEALEERMRARLSQAVQQGRIREHDLTYLSLHQLAILKQTAEFSDLQLELFRKLTVSWDLRPNSRPITSHRPLVGRLIVLGKRLFFPLVRAALQEELAQQREFNGAVIEFLAAASGGSPADSL
jgi:hypothetical protein